MKTNWKETLVCNRSSVSDFAWRDQRKPLEQGAQIFNESSSHLITLGVGRVIWCRVNADDPQIPVANLQNVVGMANWRTGIVHP